MTSTNSTLIVFDAPEFLAYYMVNSAQLRSLLILETNTDARKLVPVLHYNGMPISSHSVVEGLCEHLCVEDVA